MFLNCLSLIRIALTSCPKDISDYTFMKCKQLKVEELPSGLTFIGRHAFRDCKLLRSIQVPTSIEISPRKHVMVVKTCKV